jgi:hypothetical protein
MAPLYPPIICSYKAIAPSALDFFTCRVACSLDHTWLLSSDHIPSPLPGTITVALVPSRLGGQTALHRPAPSGVRAGHGPPGYLPIGSGRLGVPVAHLAQANSDPFPGHIPARLRPLGYRQNTRLGPTRLGIIASNGSTAGQGYIPPARVHDPAGQAQFSKSPKLRTQQATSVKRGVLNLEEFRTQTKFV